MASFKLLTINGLHQKQEDSSQIAIDFLTVNGRTIATDGSTLDGHVASTANPHSVTKTQVGLANVTNDAQLKAADLDTDVALTADSDVKVASQKAVKAYVDGATGGLAEFSDSLFRVKDNGDATKKMAFEVSAIATGTTRTITMPNAAVNLGLIASAIQSSEKGANSGVATLDGGGKVPVGQLPSSVMTYEGTFNASATPASPLLDGDVAANAGMVYLANVAGSYNFGAGAISFALGDWAIYNGSIWEKSLNSNVVASVNSQTGVVVLTTSHIAEGSNLYYTTGRFDTAFSGKTTSDLTEGSNLYYTNARAIAAPITGYASGAGTVAAADTILQAIQKLNGNIVTVSGSAVTSVNSVSPVSGDVTLTTVNISENTNLYYTNARGIGSVLTGYASGAGTVAAADTILQAVQKLNGNILLKQDIITASNGVKLVTADVQRDDAVTKTNDNAGTISALQVVYVKSNGNVDLALASTISDDTMLAIVETATIATTASGKVVLRRGAIIGGFTGLTPGKKQIVSRSSAGTLVEATTGFVVGEMVYSVGRAISATQIEFDPLFLFEF